MAEKDEIVCKGVRSLCWGICWYISFDILLIVSSMGVLLIALPCLIAMHIYIWKKWRLHLTHTAIHYQPRYQYDIIPLVDISYISVVPGSNCILINRKTSSYYNTGNVVRINDVANCNEFVEAAKAEIAQSQN